MKKTPGLESILLVDDDEITNLIHKRVIESSGLDVDVVTAASGQAALEHLQCTSTPPGLIFLDINMPGMNGWQFLEAYKLLPMPLKAKAVVIMLTTSVRQEDRDHADEHEEVGYFVRKTLTVERLLEIVASNFKLPD